MQPTKPIPTTANTAYEFALLLASYKEYAEVYSGLPDYLVQQATAKFKYFELNHTYVGGDFVRVTLLNPTLINEDTVAVKFRLCSVLNTKTGRVRCMVNPQELRPFEVYTKGFNSPLIEISRECGVFSSANFDTLIRYCRWWEMSNPWAATNVNQRVYLKPASANFLMQFMLEIRKNPKTKEDVLGLTENVFLRDATLLATFSTTEEAKAAIGKPRKQRGGQKIDIPAPRRAETDLF